MATPALTSHPLWRRLKRALWPGLPPKVTYPEPWSPCEGLTGRLAHEVGPGHVLWGRGGQVIGRNDSTDDVVVVTRDGAYAIVHLTWSAQPDPDPRWPHTTLHASAEDVSAAMLAWSKWAGYFDEDTDDPQPD